MGLPLQQQDQDSAARAQEQLLQRDFPPVAVPVEDNVDEEDRLRCDAQLRFPAIFCDPLHSAGHLDHAKLLLEQQSDQEAILVGGAA